MPHNAKPQAKELLADEFTALLQELGVFEVITASAKLTDKFNRVYTALCLEDERRG